MSAYFAQRRTTVDVIAKVMFADNLCGVEIMIFVEHLVSITLVFFAALEITFIMLPRLVFRKNTLFIDMVANKLNYL